MNAKVLTIAGAVAAALAAATIAAHAAPPAGKEACYGVSLKGQNNCAAGVHDCAGKGTADYDGGDFKFVPTGTCEKMTVHGHKGTLSPA